MVRSQMLPHRANHRAIECPCQMSAWDERSPAAPWLADLTPDLAARDESSDPTRASDDRRGGP